MKKVYVFLADGFEEIEGLTVVDVLRRAGADTETVSVMGRKEIRGSHEIQIMADSLFEDVDFSDARLLVLPGGMPGTSNLAACTPLMNKMQRHFAEGGKVAAICAAPGFVLSQLPLEKVIKANGGLRMASYEGCENPLLEKGVTVIDPRQGVIADSNIISASGPGHAVAFGLKILEHIADSKTADTVAKALML